MPISKVILNGVTQMDVTDTTAEAADVTAPEVFYSSNGTRTVGTGTGGAVLSVNGQTGTVVLDAADVGALPDTTVIPTKIDNLTIDAITEPSTQFPVPAVGDNGSTLFGKISKWFSDMAALVATKLNAANVVNNLTTTDSGYALDARQGKALKDAIPGKFLGGVSTLPTDMQNGLVGFSLAENVTVGSTILPAGTRVFGTFYNKIGHFIGIPNANNMYMLRYAGGSWEVLGQK